MNADDPAATPREEEGPVNPGAGLGLFAARGLQRAFVPMDIARRKRWDIVPLFIFMASVIALEIQGLSEQVNFGNVIMVVGALVTLGFRLATLGQAGETRFRPSPQDYIYLLILAMCGCSAVVSATPAITLTQTAYLAVLWLGAWSLAAIPIETAVRLFIRFCFVIAILSSLMIAVSPSIAFQPFSSTGLPELRGIFRHQLRLGLFMSVGVAFMIIAYLNGQAKYVIHQKSWWAWAIFIVIFLCMVASLARTNIAFMLLALPIGLGLSRRNWIRWATVIGIVVMTTVIVTHADVLLGAVADDDGKVSLSGRTLIWQRTIDASEAAPVLGHGYASFDTFIYDYIWRDYRPPHAHNSFLNAYFENGMVGVVLLAVLIIVQLVSVLRATGARRYSYALFLVLIGFLASLTGTIYAGKPSILFGLILLMVGMETSRSAPPIRRR